MELEKCKLLAEDLMSSILGEESEWNFGINNSRKVFGFCNFGIKKLLLSREFVSINTEARCKQCILHEIAHIVAGEEAGHGNGWKVECSKLGIPNEPRCFTSEDTVLPPMKYKGICPKGHISYRNIAPKFGLNYSCSICSPGVFSLNHIIKYEKSNGS